MIDTYTIDVVLIYICCFFTGYTFDMIFTVSRSRGQFCSLHVACLPPESGKQNFSGVFDEFILGQRSRCGLFT